MPDESAPARRSNPLNLGLAFAVTALAVVVPLVNEAYRPWNFALFGALGLFAAARLGGGWGFALCLGGKIVSDVMNWAKHHQQPDYFPTWQIVLCFAAYPLAGLLLRRTGNLVFVAGTAFLASAAFFVASNTGAWIGHALPYPMTFAGWLEAMELGLPFYRGTLIGDVGAALVLFPVSAALVPVTVEECRTI